MNVASYLRQNFVKLVKYGISGLSAAGVQFVFFYIFTDIVGIWYLLSVVLAFGLALATGFLMHKYWTFQDYTRHTIKRQSILYTFISLTGLGLNVMLMYILVDIVGLGHILAQAFVLVIVAGLNFLINNKITFRQDETSDTITNI